MEITCKNIILADNVKICDDIFSRTRGLRFSRRLKMGDGLILVANGENTFETTIDMLFVFSTIDILWLNSKKEVVDMRRNVRPFTPFITPKKPAKYVIELPKSSTLNVKIGDAISF